MKALQYKVTLLSDVILNPKAATDGPNNTLDFIPGNCFLGIVAGKLYQDGEDSMIDVFHSNMVRFGDAHPAHGGYRTLRVPADMYYPKLGTPEKELYISHAIPEDEKTQDEMRKTQLKQCRTGFYNFSSTPAIPVNTDTTFAIKSAHDRHTRTSKKEAMYGYESLGKGLELYFTIEVEDDNLVQQIDSAIQGVHRVGRSRSAQYGLVEINRQKYDEVCSNIGKDVYTVYADGRLIFLDENGMPTFRIKAEQLGFQNGSIDWEKSQIRTFRYANWNGKRQCFDADRCGIEKGSVFVIKGGTCPTKSSYVGSFNNEGFGKVIYNPEFLAADATGKANLTLGKAESANKPIVAENIHPTTPLLKYLTYQNNASDTTSNMYRLVNEWVDKNARYFTSKAFASQWGTIRALAALKKDRKSIYDQLFAKETGYLMHGIGEEKWIDGGRRDVFEKFVLDLNHTFEYEEDIRMTIVNLAAEMAKRCRKENKNESK